MGSESNKKLIKNEDVKRAFKFSKSIVIRLIDGAVSTAAMVLAIYSFAFEQYIGSGTITGALFAVLAFSIILKAFFYKTPEKNLKLILNLIVSAIFIVVSILLFVFGITGAILRLYVTVYLASLVLNRVMSILANKRFRNIVINSLMIMLIMALLILFFIDVDNGQEIYMLIVGLIIAGQALIHIISVSFSQMKLKIILKIIRKTYAAEILFGLLLLIFAFSFVFQVLEPSITRYADALWYCFAIVTTIGFGDFTVTSLISRVLSVILGIYGIIAVAMITSIIVNFYHEVRSEQDDSEERSEKKEDCKTKS